MEEDTLPVTANIADKDASVTVHIVDDKNLLKDFTTLKSINDDQEVSLNSKGAVISQKMAEKMEKGIGDTITFKDANDNEIEVKITDIYETMLDIIFMLQEICMIHGIQMLNLLKLIY